MQLQSRHRGEGLIPAAVTNKHLTESDRGEVSQEVRMTEKKLLQQYVQIGVVVAAYWFISITLGKIISPVSE